MLSSYYLLKNLILNIYFESNHVFINYLIVFEYIKVTELSILTHFEFFLLKKILTTS